MHVLALIRYSVRHMFPKTYALQGTKVYVLGLYTHACMHVPYDSLLVKGGRLVVVIAFKQEAAPQSAK